MSKRIWQHPEVPANETTTSWRSVGQLEDTAEFREWADREFPQGAAELQGEEDMETTRRSFLKLMGASTALAGFGMAACRRPEQHILPFAKAPEWIIPGKALYYASSLPRSGGATPLVVTSFEGRPTKVAPNTLHPDADGTDAFAQASVLDLYSPSRSRVVLENGKPSSLAAFGKAVAELAKDKTAKLGVVFGADDSPTRNRLTKELKSKFSNAKFYQYEALEGNAAAALGDGVQLVPDFEKADRILSLDCDFLCLDPQGGQAAFSARRQPEGKGYKNKADDKSMNRLYVVESAYSLTGGMADHRLRVTADKLLTIAAAIAKELGANVGSVQGALETHEQEWVKAAAADLRENKGKSIVLAGSRQPAALHHIALAINLALGSIGEGKALKAVQQENTGLGDLAKLVADLNSGAINAVILLTPSNPVYDAPADLKFAEAFAKAKTRIHVGSRTDATAHASTWHVPGAHYLEQWSDARTRGGVYTIVQPMILPLYPDVVSELELLVAMLDAEGKLTTGEGPKGEPSPAFDAVKATFTALGGSTEEAWKNLLRNGFHAGSKYAAASPSVSSKAAADIAAAKLTAPSADSLHVIFATDASILDGRYIENGWLQESPDPISKLTWDNAALIAPKTAKALGIYDQIIQLEPETDLSALSGGLAKSWKDVKNAPMHPDGEGEHRKAPLIKVTVNGVSLEIPVIVAFGQAENTLVIPLGYGQGFDKEDELKRGTENQAHVGLVGVNRGFNAYPLRSAATALVATGAKVEKTTKRYSLALTQEHNSMYGRALAREISTVTDVQKDEHGKELKSVTFAEQLANVAKQGNDAHAPENISLYKQENHKGETLLSDTLNQWGMTIDLSSCTGCNACLVACQAENNIPIVGKEQVARGREMHWIRMDRYFASQKDDETNPKNSVPEWIQDNPEMIPQPVACVQCESAPCETVCPVNATVHTEDGLNAMAYNRCIGTRYCANNCPYKARRFNYFDYNKRNPLIAHNLYRGPLGEKQVGNGPHLQRNPNVTVRMRGVMEKCTYCVQRLKDAKIRQKRGQKQEALVAGKPSQDMTVSNETLRVTEAMVKVACQEACASSAITFGNLLEKGSTLDRAKHIERNYDLLNYIGTRPRTSYLARVKNPNDKMPDAKHVGKATIHMA